MGKAMEIQYFGTGRGAAALTGTKPSSGIGTDLFLRWGVKHAVDLNEIVVEQPLNLDHGPGWIGRPTPQLGLRLVDHRRVAVEVADIDREPHAIPEARALGLRDQFEIAEGLNNARLRILHQNVGRWIHALHSGDKDEVSGSDAQAPRPSA